jgi:hypothetical protein
MAGKSGRSGRPRGKRSNLWVNPVRACAFRYNLFRAQEEMLTGRTVALPRRKQLAELGIEHCAGIYAHARRLHGVEKQMQRPTAEAVMREATRRRLIRLEISDDFMRFPF